MLDKVRRRDDGIPSGVALPLRLVEGPLTWPGQDAGFLGPRHDPWQLKLDPNKPDAKDDSLALPEGLDPARLHRRRHLLGQTAPIAPGDAFADQQDSALAMLCNGRVGRALDLEREDPRLVDRYGQHLFGRSLLMARRLVEAGVPIVQASMGIVQTWDTHVANFPRLKNSLLPALDRAVSTLLDDLQARGLLDETLVVMLSEFGRTPKISELTPGAVPGRDHWPKVFPAVFAGAGVVGGQVIGKSDKIGAYPDLPIVRPARPRRDDLSRPRRRPRDRDPGPAQPPLDPLLGRGHGPALHDGAGLIRCPSRPTSDPSPRPSTSSRHDPRPPEIRAGGDDLCHLRRVHLVVTDRKGNRAEGWGETPLSVQWVWPGPSPTRNGTSP